MNELEQVLLDELKMSRNFESFFVKVNILQSHFNKNELKTLSKVVTNNHFLNLYPQSITFINEGIMKEKILPFNNISESQRIKSYLKDMEV